jgi:hypothetical protein
MTATRLTIDTLFDAFFPPIVEESSGILRHRTIRVMNAIDRFLETEGERTLDPSDAAVLAAERQFDPNGAFVRTMAAHNLVCALPLFLEDPWLHPEPLMQRVQLDVVQRLVAFVSANVPMDDAEVGPVLTLISLRISISRRKLNRAQKEARRVREPPGE